MTATTGSNLPRQEFFTPIEIADILGVTRHTVYQYLKDPNCTLKGVRLSHNVIRIPRSNLVQYLEEKYGQQSH